MPQRLTIPQPLEKDRRELTVKRSPLALRPSSPVERLLQTRKGWGWSFLFLLIFALYMPVLSVGFFSDDLLFSVLSQQDLLTLFRGAQGFLHYRPLSMALFWLIQQGFGYDRAAFHFLTLSIHMLNTALLYPVLRRLGASFSVAGSAVVLFGLFPFAHEPIAFVMGSVHSLALFWMLLATWLILTPGSRGMTAKVLAAFGAYGAAILSHETGIVWPAWLLGIALWRPGRFPIMRGAIPAGFALGIGYMLLWRTLPRGDPGVLALPIFTLESSLYAMQGWLHPLGPIFGALWKALFAPRPILLRALRPEDWLFLGLGAGITLAMARWAWPRWSVPLGLWGFGVSITPALIFWGPASGMMNYPRMLLIPGIWSALAWAGVLEGIRRHGAWGRSAAAVTLGSALTISMLLIASSLGYYRDATQILRGMAQAAREAKERPILFVNMPYNVGYRWFRARYYPYPYGGAGAVLITDDRQLAWYIRINGGPDLTDRPRGWVRSARVDALYPGWFTPAPPVGFHELRDALKDHAVYVFQEDLSWIPLHHLWRVEGAWTKAFPPEEELNWLDPAPLFDRRIKLLGWRVEEATEELILLWEAEAAPGHRWQVFVHLLNAEGRMIGQADGPMADGLAPTDAWRRGDRVIDRRPLPAGLQPVAFRVGLYDLESGKRPIVEWKGELVEDGSIILPVP